MNTAQWFCVRIVAVVSLLATWGFAATSLGADEPAITRIADVDADFALTGEYLGELTCSGGAAPQTYGLQVIPLGQGRFEGVLIAGGLPGNPGLGQQRSSLQGERIAETPQRVRLTGTGWEIELGDQRASVRQLDHGGQAVCDVGALSHVTRHSQLEGLAPPPHAYVLFDGSNTGAFRDGKVIDGLLQSGTEIIPLFRDFHLHVEFLVPYMPLSNSQARGNSGIYLHSRYEIQILDTFGHEGLANECGGIYKQCVLRLNMAFPPLSWQTYDITFRAARFDHCGNKIANACVTVLHNGVVIHDHVAITTKTGADNPKALAFFRRSYKIMGIRSNFAMCGW